MARIPLLLVCGGLLACQATSQGVAPAASDSVSVDSPALAPAAMVGVWRIDLRPTPDAEPYYQELVVTEVDGGTLSGSFYNTAFTGGRVNADWGDIRFAFVTEDGSGVYHTSGVFDGQAIRGTTHSLGRGFLAVWSGERISPDGAAGALTHPPRL